MYFGTLQILHLLEDLKMALEMLKDPQEKEALRNQIPGSTAACIHDWLKENLVSSFLFELYGKKIDTCVMFVCVCMHTIFFPFRL